VCVYVFARKGIPVIIIQITTKKLKWLGKDFLEEKKKITNFKRRTYAVKLAKE